MAYIEPAVGVDKVYIYFILLGISTYRKTCPNCNMVYRYQDWQDGIHNFDDHVLLSVHLCLVLRNALQVSSCFQ